MNRKDISYVFKKWLLADKERIKFSAYIYKNTTLEILITLWDFGWDLFIKGINGINFMRERK